MINLKTQKEFLEALAEELRFLPAKQVNETLKHYRDKINVEVDYGTKEEKVIASLKEPAEIAKNIYEMHGIDYLKKRKKQVRIKEILTAIWSALVILVSLALFIVGSIFIVRICINMFTLIPHLFTFHTVLDSLITTLFIISYLWIMVIVYVYIIDLFWIIIHSFLSKIMDAIPKLRNKSYPFMEFTINGWLNQKTKKTKIVLKALGFGVLLFFAFGIISYTTKGYVYRSIQDTPKIQKEYVISDSFDKIQIEVNRGYVMITEDSNITVPKIVYNFELDKLEYQIVNGTLDVKVSKSVTYDFLGVLQGPASRIQIYVPVGFDLSNLDIRLDYGKVILSKMSHTANVKVYIHSGSLSFYQNKNINRFDLEVFHGTVSMQGNSIQESEIHLGTGEYKVENDAIQKLTLQNESAKLTILKSKIDDWTFTNKSGTVYIEKISGQKLDYQSTTSINELYDLNYEVGELKILNTGSLKMVRSYFQNQLIVTSSSSSYQVLEYIKTPDLQLNDQNGQIILENCNTNYSEEELLKLDEAYRVYGREYNEYTISNPKVKIEGKRTKLSIQAMKIDTLKLTLSSGATEMENIESKTSEIHFSDVGAKIYEFYGDTLYLKLLSSNFSNKTSVDLMNDHTSNLEVTVEGDGLSELMTENITIK